MFNSLPSVSVIMPAYNAERYIAESIESILSQTFMDFELIVIDDCSTDRTPNIIEKYRRKDSRIVALTNQTNLGIAGNRNRGLVLARGKYIAWQDADDVSLSDRLLLQYEYLQAHPKVAIIGGWLEFFDNTGTLHVRKYFAEDIALREKIFQYSPVSQGVAMIRKQCLDLIGKYNLAYPLAEDLDMSFRLGEKFEFANIPKILLRYRQHDSSATFSQLKTMELNTIAIRRRYFFHPSYHANFIDFCYNFFQYLSIFIVPPRFKIWLFNRMRNSDV